MLGIGIQVILSEMGIDELIQIEENNRGQYSYDNIFIIPDTKKQKRDYIADIKEILHSAIMAYETRIDEYKGIDNKDIYMACQSVMASMVEP